MAAMGAQPTASAAIPANDHVNGGENKRKKEEKNKTKKKKKKKKDRSGSRRLEISVPSMVAPVAAHDGDAISVLLARMRSLEDALERERRENARAVLARSGGSDSFGGTLGTTRGSQRVSLADVAVSSFSRSAPSRGSSQAAAFNGTGPASREAPRWDDEVATGALSRATLGPADAAAIRSVFPPRSELGGASRSPPPERPAIAADGAAAGSLFPDREVVARRAARPESAAGALFPTRSDVGRDVLALHGQQQERRRRLLAGDAGAPIPATASHGAGGIGADWAHLTSKPAVTVPPPSSTSGHGLFVPRDVLRADLSTFIAPPPPASQPLASSFERVGAGDSWRQPMASPPPTSAYPVASVDASSIRSRGVSGSPSPPPRAVTPRDYSTYFAPPPSAASAAGAVAGAPAPVSRDRGRPASGRTGGSLAKAGGSGSGRDATEVRTLDGRVIYTLRN